MIVKISLLTWLDRHIQAPRLYRRCSRRIHLSRSCSLSPRYNCPMISATGQFQRIYEMATNVFSLMVFDMFLVCKIFRGLRRISVLDGRINFRAIVSSTRNYSRGELVDICKISFNIKRKKNEPIAKGDKKGGFC